MTISLAGETEKKLLEEARLGDGAAFAEMILPSAQAVFRRARRSTGSVADAEDVRQETVLKAYARLGQFAGASKGQVGALEFRAWVARIGVNASIDLLRKRAKQKTQSLEWEPETDEKHTPRELADGAVNPEERYARREMCKLMVRAITTLEPDLRQVCLMRDILEYSTQEVAERLGISLLAVRLRLYRAHVKLRDKMHQVMKTQAARRAGQRLARAEASRPQTRAFRPVQECCFGD